MIKFWLIIRKFQKIRLYPLTENKQATSVEFHVKGIKKMVEKRKSCEEILIQISAIEAAMHKVGQIILEDHLTGCVVEGIKEGKEEEIIKKLKAALNKFV